MASDFYKVLGITSSASPEEVRKAYKKKALETHPDKLVHLTTEEVKESAAARFRNVHEAFQVLNDPYQRSAYDIRIKQRTDTVTTSKSWVQLDEEQIARMKDRAEWARQATQRRKEGITALNEARKVREASRRAQQEQQSFVDRETIDQMLEDLCRLNPEWQIRKEEARRRKAERERLGAAASSR